MGVTTEDHADRDDRLYHEWKDRVAEERSIAAAERAYVEAEQHIVRGTE